MTVAKDLFTRHIFVSFADLIYVTHNEYLITVPFDAPVTKSSYSFCVYYM